MEQFVAASAHLLVSVHNIGGIVTWEQLAKVQSDIYNMCLTASQKEETHPTRWSLEGQASSLKHSKHLYLCQWHLHLFWNQALFIHLRLLIKRKKQIFFLLWWDQMSSWLFTGTHVVNGGIKRFITNDIDCLSGPQLCSCHKRTQVQLHYNACSVDVERKNTLLRRKKTLINSLYIWVGGLQP